MLATVSMQAQKISHIEILLSGKSFTRRKIRLKSHKRVSASFVTLLVAKKVRPTFGVRPQLPEALSQKCTGLPLQPPTRTRSARVRCFSFFAFTSSPYDCKQLGNSDLRVKVSPLFPSPVKAKKSLFFTHNTHCINELRVKVKGEGKNFELAECAMRRGVSVRA